MLQQPRRARAGFGRSGGLSRAPCVTIAWSRGKKPFDFLDRIDKYIRELNFLGPVSRNMAKVLAKNRIIQPHKMKKIDSDVQLVKDYLIETLGGTWADACVPREQTDSLLVNPARSPRPWESVERMLEDDLFNKWVRGHLHSKVPWM